MRPLDPVHHLRLVHHPHPTPALRLSPSTPRPQRPAAPVMDMAVVVEASLADCPVWNSVQDFLAASGEAPVSYTEILLRHSA